MIYLNKYNINILNYMSISIDISNAGQCHMMAIEKYKTELKQLNTNYFSYKLIKLTASEIFEENSPCDSNNNKQVHYLIKNGFYFHKN